MPINATKQEIENAVKAIYQENFGRQPTQSELDSQRISIERDGYPALQAIRTWAVNHPDNFKKTGVVSEPQSFQGKPLPAFAPTPTPESKSTPELKPPPAVVPNITTPPTNKKFQESDAYKSLSAEEKEIADLLFNVISVGGEAEATTFANAIQQSIAVAEPWAKAQAAMALAEFAGAVDETIFGFAAKTEAIQRARDILAEDVISGKEFLTLEQQSEVARQVSQYDEDLLSIADQAAEKGLTFATGARSRALAEERRGAQFQDVIESSRRKTNFQIKELELKAARGDIDAQKKLETLAGEQGFALRKIGRSAEEILGSERARQLGVAGFTPSGGVMGTLEEEKEKKIISDIGGIVGLTDLLTT